MGKNERNMKEKSRLRCKPAEHRETEQSVYCEVRGSDIHGQGIYATQNIPEGTRIIEYIGELIDKVEGTRRALDQQEKAKGTGDGAVYLFILNRRWDIDGNVPWNTARLINHSCDPNCETYVEGKRIYFHALREISKGEELTYDYGFDVEVYEDHPCHCGSPKCVGYIVSREQWDELRNRLAVGKDLRMLEGDWEGL